MALGAGLPDYWPFVIYIGIVSIQTFFAAALIPLARMLPD